MELDFSKLDKIGKKEINKSIDKKNTPQTPEEGTKTENMGRDIKTNINALNERIGAFNGLASLQKEADKQKAVIDGARAVYREYQENIKKSAKEQIEILKGLKEGNNIYILFLKAIEIIGTLTNNGVILEQAQEDIKSIYGIGLEEAGAKEIEIEEIKKRLEKLKKAFNEEHNKDIADNIKRAIEAHKAKINRLSNV